jgi:predicted amidohydrolase YtcJ
MKMAWRKNLIIGLVLATAGVGFSTDVMAQQQRERPVPADMVFLNGKIFTADPRSSTVEALAVKDGHFLAVGSTQALRRYIGGKTLIVDLHGHFVTPGLADGHFHNEGGGPGIDLSQTRSLAALLAVVEQAAKNAKPGDVIVSNNDWHEAQLKEKRLPLASELDRVAPNNPVVLVRGGHEMILNTAALKKWNITKDTVAPQGGEISKGADGAPTGEIFDNAKQLVELPPPPPVTVDDVLATQRKLNAYGITSVRIPGQYKSNLFNDYKLLKQVRDSGRLTLRYTVYLPGFGTRDPAKIREMIVGSGLAQDEGDEWVRIGGMKLLVDGGFEGGHMTKPYAEPYGKGGTFYGVTVVPPANFTEVVKEVNRLGWRVSTHAVGDAAVDEVLDAYEAANAEKSIIGKRWTIEHAFVVRPDQIARMKKLGLILSVQDHLYLAAPVLVKYWGKERADEVTPVKTYLDNGFLLVGGTDSPVVPFNPFWEIYHFLTRDTISDGVHGADQRVQSRQTLLRMITINYAKMTGEDAIKGSIEPGKLADFAILSDDVLTVPAKRLVTMHALATYVGGKEVYRDPSFRSDRATK